MSTAADTALSPLDRPCPFISFYSFKGGVGRSMALINVAGILAARGFRALVLDMDLEAPGISYLANEGNADRERLQPGLVDLLLDATERGPDGDLFALPPAEAIRRYCAPYELPEGFRRSPDAALSIMPAGRLDRGYAGRLERLDLPGLYREGHGYGVMLAFKQVVQDSKLFDYVFVDSRTGFSDESGICTRDLADYLIVLSGLNKQNIEGTAAFLKALRVATGGERKVEVVLSPVPNGEDALVDERTAIARAAYSDAWGAPIACELQIPYHPQLALTEEPHIFRRRRGYLFEAYHALERRTRELTGDTPEGLLEAALADYKAQRFEAALTRLERAILLEDGSRAIDAFTTRIAATDPLPATLAPQPFIHFIAANASETARTNLALAISKIGKIDDTSDREAVGRAILQLHRRTLDGEAPPRHVLLRCAQLLWHEFNEHDEAEALLRRAFTLKPDLEATRKLTEFLINVRGDLDGAERVYREAAEHSTRNVHEFTAKEGRGWSSLKGTLVQHSHAWLLCGFAEFMRGVRNDIDTAESLYKHAVASAPGNASVLGSYAIFLEHERKAPEEAESVYEEALEANPNNAHILGNYARLLLTRGQLVEGLALVERAVSHLDSAHIDAIDLECWMYLYCCAAAARRDEALGRLHRLVTGERVTTGGWDFSGVIAQAVQRGHPEAEWLPRLAEVLAGRQPHEALAGWSAWTSAAGSRSG